MGSSVKNYTSAAAGLSLLLFLLFFYWFKPGIGLLAGYLLLCLIAVLSIPILYRLAGFSRQDESRWLEEREERDYRELLTKLETTRNQLAKLEINEGVQQTERLTDLIDDYHTVVETRFLGKKHMPLEYLGAARQVQKQAVQNLSDVVTVAHSMQAIDSNRSRTTSFESQLTGRSDKHDTLYSEQAGRVRKLLDENNQLFDALTETAVEVANIDSFSRYERIDTLSRLVSLSQIASNSGK